MHKGKKMKAKTLEIIQRNYYGYPVRVILMDGEEWMNLNELGQAMANDISNLSNSNSSEMH